VLTSGGWDSVTAVPPREPSLTPAASVPSSAGGPGWIEAKVSANVDSTVRWTDGERIHEFRLDAGDERRWTISVPAAYLVVITVAGDGTGKVACGVTDFLGGRSTSVEAYPGDRAPVTRCHSFGPVYASGYQPDPDKRHLVTFSATASDELAAWRLTENGVQFGTVATATDRVNGGTAAAVVANMDGVSSCAFRLDDQPEVEKSVRLPGEIAVCGAAVG
ncbi:MAG: hypothetical protein REI45_11355, partial [Propionicimonas sp.]|nr:hypothetical protein [Propionicimonas sp.]